MANRTLDDAWSDLVAQLQHLEAMLPPPTKPIPRTTLGTQGGLFKRFELEEDVRELEEFIANAGEPEDEHSLAALTFLQTELIRKRSLLGDF